MGQRTDDPPDKHGGEVMEEGSNADVQLLVIGKFSPFLALCVSSTLFKYQGF